MMNIFACGTFIVSLAMQFEEEIKVGDLVRYVEPHTDFSSYGVVTAIAPQPDYGTPYRVLLAGHHKYPRAVWLQPRSLEAIRTDG